jgi:peptide/nickel transport system permease protein/oligopeptide transport system permease protein
MIHYIIKRLLLAVPTILGVIFIVMLTIEMVPGDPVMLMLGEQATKEAVENVRTALGLDKPMVTRYFLYLRNLAKGDMGRSIRENRLVSREISDVWPATLELTVAAMVIALTIGMALGILSSVRPNSFFDSINRVLSLFGLSMPVFWVGLVLIVVFAYWLRLFPIGGTGSLRHLVLPAVTLSLPSIAMVSRMTRSSLLEVLKEDYVRTARSKGVSEKKVILKHALKNALIPIVTLSGLQLGQLMGGAILTETVFAWPGLGRLMVRAIFARDYILLQGAVLVFALAFVLINLIVDLSYCFLDPRVSYK